MGAVAERLDLSTPGRTERDVVREWLRAEAGLTEGTEVEAEFVGVGTGGAGPFALANANVMEGTLRVLVGSPAVLQVEGTAYSADYIAGGLTFLAGSFPAVGAPIMASYRHGVASSIEDSLLDTLIAAAKAAADDFLGPAFAAKVATLTLSGVVAGDSVYIDGYTYQAASATDVTKRQFQVGATDEDTAGNLLTCLSCGLFSADDIPYGLVDVDATRSGAVLSLALQPSRTKRVHMSSNSSRIVCTYVRTDLAIPEPVKLGVLRFIARHYQQRVDGLKAESVSGLSSQDWSAPAESLALWQPYKVYSGL
jgi:hypothetical protein